MPLLRVKFPTMYNLQKYKCEIRHSYIINYLDLYLYIIFVLYIYMFIY